MAEREASPTLAEALKPWFNRGWRFFCSVRLALILILILTLLTLIGTLVMQVPAEVRADPQDYQWWLNNPARERFGLWAKPMGWVGFLDVFHSPWFYIAGSLLMLNIAICTINRWRGIWASFRLQVRLPQAFYQGTTSRIALSALALGPQEAKEGVRSLLRRRGYRVLEENHPEALYLAADKNRYSRLGTLVVHFSILLFILGYLLGSYFGFRNTTFMVPEGSVREVGYGTNLSLELISFVDEYWPEGPPKDFRSEVILYERGQEVKRGTVRVNHYLGYKRINFYQSYYGQAVAMEVKDSQGETVFNDGVALGWQTGREPLQRPLGMFGLGGYQVYVIGKAQGYFDPLIKAGQVRLEVYEPETGRTLAITMLDQGQPKEVLGLTFTFVREKQFSGLQVSRDPANSLIWISSGLFTLGLGIVFFFPHRRLWALCRKGDEGTELVIRGTGRGYELTTELESLRAELEEKSFAQKV